MKRSLFALIACNFLSAMIFTGTVAAQTVTGSLVGHIEDSNGASIPGAKVLFIDIDRNTTREVMTNDEGNFSIGSVDPGAYRVEIEAANFKKFIRERVDVAINTTIRVDAALEAGAISEIVQVSGEQAQLKTDRADVGGQITSDQASNLPLSVDRNYQSALETIPGVSEPSTVGSSFGNPNGSLISRVNGQNERYNNFQLDGTINNQTNVISQTAIVPPADAIQVVDVSTNSYDAEQGRAAGGVVNVQIKSGTNDFRGTAFVYNTNSAFSARNAFSSSEPPNTNLTQFGGTFGGPIIKDKTFFFGYYQGGRDRRGQNTTVSVPIAAYRNGNFSSALGNYICFRPGAIGQIPTAIQTAAANSCPSGADPFTATDTNGQVIQVRVGQIFRPTLASASNRIAYAGNIIPQSEFNPAARAILNLLPLPNLPGATNNYEATGSFIQDREDFGIKVNHNFSENTTIFARYSFFKSNTSDLPVFGDLGGPNSNGGATASVGPGRNDSISANLTHVFSPNLITEFRFGYVGVHITGSNPSSENLGNSLGIINTNIDDFFSATGIPQITISGYDSLGSATTLPFDITERSFNIVNNWTKIIGNHTIRFGGDIRRLVLDKSQATSSNPRGLYTFTTGVTGTAGVATTASNPGRPASLTSNANAFSSFLLGQPQAVRRTTVAQLNGYITPQYFFFAQDRWQVNPKLTVSYGLRYELYPYPSGTNPGDQSYYDPATNTVLVSGYGPNDDRLNIPTEKGNLAPRLGIAYRFDDKTVVRAGYGVSYVPITLNSLANQNFGSQIDLQLAGTTAAFGPSVGGSPITLTTGIPAAAPVDLTSGVVTAPNTAVVGVVNPNAKRGYIQSYNFTVERDLFGFVTSVGYVGSRGTRLPGTLNLNAAGPGAASGQRPFALRYGRTADVLLSDFMLSNAYHSMQIQSDKRFRGSGGRLTIAYTWSKSLDYTDAFSLDNDINIDANRGPSPFDRTHNLVVSHVIRLPFGDGGKLFDDNGLRWQGLLGGFSLSGTFVARSGTPVDVSGTNAANTATQGTVNRPNVIADPYVAGPVAANSNALCQLTVSQGGIAADEVYTNRTWFNPCAFDNPAGFTFGNVGRNALRGPHYFNYNATLSRMFQINEQFRIQGQMSVFNVTNSTHFANPSGSYTGGTFGRITSSFGERQIRFGLRFIF